MGEDCMLQSEAQGVVGAKATRASYVCVFVLMCIVVRARVCVYARVPRCPGAGAGAGVYLCTCPSANLEPSLEPSWKPFR